MTGMSGAGKTTLLAVLSGRGLPAIDTDYDDWVLPDGTWDEPRMDQLARWWPKTWNRSGRGIRPTMVCR